MESIVKPITPDDALNESIKTIPSNVIKSFNNLIIKNYNKNINSASFTMKAIIEEIQSIFLKEGYNISLSIIFKNKWLDVKLLYETNGWIVNQPNINSISNSYFVFSKK